MNEEAGTIETSKKLAALRQIHAAIELCYKSQIEAVITLAAAAEGCIPPTDDPHLLKAINDLGLFKELEFNLVINWLKHTGGPESAILTEFEASITIVRAISKFVAAYHQCSKEMEQFLEWSRVRGHVPQGAFR